MLLRRRGMARSWLRLLRPRPFACRAAPPGCG